MDRVNPLYIPRNHVTDAALEAAEQGGLSPFHRLLGTVSTPFTERPGLDDLARAAPVGGSPHVTDCGI